MLQATQTGEVTKYSIDYYVLLREMAWLERKAGSTANADTDDAKALYAWVAEWSEFLPLETTPVLEDADAGHPENGAHDARVQTEMRTAEDDAAVAACQPVQLVEDARGAADRGPR